MNVIVEKRYNIKDIHRAAALTVGGKIEPKAPTDKWLAWGHSPIRLMRYWVEFHGIPAFVSTHLVRHKHGVEHFVQSLRDDRGGNGSEDRNTPVIHGMDINADAIIAISKKRLCYASHVRTVAVWSRLRKSLQNDEPSLAYHMAPACAWLGYCPEPRECKPGLQSVLSAYSESFPMKKRPSINTNLSSR